MNAAMANWITRHRNPWNLALHAVGIPLLIGGLILGAIQLWQGRWDLWWRPVGLIVISYLLQWIGHRIEGNDVGEVIVIKKLLGMPYVAVSERYAPSEPTQANE